jgi:hypothetical protein
VKKKPLTAGDRVRVYDVTALEQPFVYKGRIFDLFRGIASIEVDGQDSKIITIVHPKQCRRLKVKT